MVVIHISGWDKSRELSDWGGHVNKQLAGRLQSICPSLRLTDRKRLAKRLADGAIVSIVVENPRFAESTFRFFESIGAAVSMGEEMKPNKAPKPTPMSVTPRATEGDSK